MTPEPHDERLDALVRAHLHRQEAAVDAAGVRDGVRRRLVAAPRRHWRRAVRCVGGVVAAAAVAAFLLWGLPSGTAQASPEVLVREAQAVHAGPVDRCYEVRTDWESPWTRRFPALAAHRLARLWTRGDRFVLETTTGDQRAAWGRDDQGRVWVALGSRVGLLFDADELGGGVNVVCEALTMKLESLLRELPLAFELRREDVDARRCRVVATPKPGRPPGRLLGAVLELNLETKVVERLELRRADRGQAIATVTLTLAETGQLPDERYQPSGHLERGVKPFGPDRRWWRDLIWKRVLEKRG